MFVDAGGENESGLGFVVGAHRDHQFGLSQKLYVFVISDARIVRPDDTFVVIGACHRYLNFNQILQRHICILPDHEQVVIL